MALMEQKNESAGPLESLVDRMFDEFPFFEWSRLPQVTATPLDLYERDGKYVLDVSVPGYEAKDVNIEVSGNTVTVSGARSQTEEKKNAHYHRREMRSGSFRRSVTLPADIDANDVEATLSKGVLTVTLTPSKPIAAKKVAITTT